MKYFQLFLAGLILGVLFTKGCYNSSDTITTDITGLQDSVLHYKDEYGKLQTLTKVVSISNTNQLATIQSQDSLIIRLQAMARQASGKISNIIVHDVITQYKDTGVVITHHDTLNIQDNVYEMVLDNDWIKASAMNNAGIGTWDIKLINKFDYTQQYTKTGILGLGAGQHTISVENINPYTSTTGLKSIVVKDKPKPFGLGLFLGYGIDNSLKPTPLLGVGIGYNIVRF